MDSTTRQPTKIDTKQLEEIQDQQPEDPYEGGSTDQYGDESPAPYNPEEEARETEVRNIIKGVETSEVRSLLESTWSTQLNPQNQNQVQSLKQRIQQLETDYQQKVQDYWELKAEIKEHNVDIRLQTAQVSDYQRQCKDKDDEITILESKVEQMQKQFDEELEDLRQTNTAIILQANIQLKQAGADILNDASFSRGSTDELGRPLDCVVNADKADTLNDQNLLAAKDLEIIELQNKLNKLMENRNEVCAAIVDIYQSGDGSREKLLMKAKAEWKSQYYLNHGVKNYGADDSIELNDDLMDQKTLRRSNSQRILNTRDEVFQDMHQRLMAQIREREMEIHAIQKDFDDRVEGLTVDMSILRSQLPSNKYRTTKKFHVLPGYKVENNFQYPDMLALTELTFEELQPMRLGLNQFSAMAQFGQVQPMNVGMEYERKNNKVQCVINQLREDGRVAKIEYNWKRYENAESALFFFRFKFFDKDDRLVGQCQNLSDQQFKDAVVKYGYKFVTKNNEYQFVNSDEVIVAVKLGMRTTSSIVNIQFIISKI